MNQSTPTELTHETLISVFLDNIKKEFTHDILRSLICKNGNTQDCENRYKTLIRQILDYMNIEFDEAHSQEPYDFRLMFKGIKYWVEIKKLDTPVSKLNDTYPKEESHYIFLYTAKNKSHTPGVLYVKGCDFPDREFHNTKKEVIDFYRKSSKSPTTMSSVYPRLNISIDSSFFVPLLEQEGYIPVSKSTSTKVKCFCGSFIDPIKGLKTHVKTKKHIHAVNEKSNAKKSNEESESSTIHPCISTIGDKLLQNPEFAKNWSGDKMTLYNAVKGALE